MKILGDSYELTIESMFIGNENENNNNNNFHTLHLSGCTSS